MQRTRKPGELRQAEAEEGISIMRPPNTGGVLQYCSVEPSKNAEITSAISRQVVQLATQRFGSSLRAIVLTGSLARAEGSFAQETYIRRVLGDAELFLVFNKGSRLPERASLCSLELEIETVLLQTGIKVHVGLSPVWP